MKQQACTLLILIALAHQTTSAQKLVVGRTLSTVSQSKKEAFDKEWEQKQKTLLDNFNIEKSKRNEHFNKKVADLKAQLKDLIAKDKANLPFDLNPVPTNDQRIASWRENLMTKLGAQAQEKYYYALFVNDKATWQREYEIDISNPEPLQRTLQRLIRPFENRQFIIEHLYKAKKQIILNSCENSINHQCNKQLSTLEAERISELDKLNKFYQMRRQFIEKQIKDVSTGTLKISNPVENTKIRNDHLRKQSTLHVEKEIAAKNILDSEIAEVSKKVEAEIEKLKVNIGSTMTLKEKKEYLLYLEKWGVINLENEKQKEDVSTFSVFQNERQSLENQKKQAWDALNANGNHSTQV